MSEKKVAQKIIDYLRIEVEVNPGNSASDITEIASIIKDFTETKLSALRAEVEALKWVVKRLEYIEESDEYLLCPICRGEKPTHYEDCELAAALNAPSEGQKRE